MTPLHILWSCLAIWNFAKTVRIYLTGEGKEYEYLGRGKMNLKKDKEMKGKQEVGRILNELFVHIHPREAQFIHIAVQDFAK